MKIKKGQLLFVRDCRKGNYSGIATEDFDTEEDEWYSISLVKGTVDGITTKDKWIAGDDISARRGLCRVEIENDAYHENNGVREWINKQHPKI